MAEVQTIDRNYSVAPTDIKKMLFTALIGATVGVVAWGVGLIISNFLIDPIFCSAPDSAEICQTRDTVGFNIALIMASFGGLLAMIKARIYRPLLISIASVVTLWGVLSLLTTEMWAISLLWVILLSTLSYALFGWIAQLRSFVASLVLVVLVVVGFRLIVSL